MEIQRYKNEWGNVPALHAVCAFFASHLERQTTAPMEIGYFLHTFAQEHRAQVLQARALNAQIQAAREEGNAGEVERLTAEKKKSKTNAPYIIPAGYYPTTHNAMSTCEPSGVMCIDIDRQDNPQFTREEWAELPRDLMASNMGKYVAFIGESRSGWEVGGYFVLIRVEASNEWVERFASVARWFSANGVKVDEAAKNMNHGRALSYQDNTTRNGFTPLPVTNANAQPYTGKYSPPKSMPKPYKGNRTEDFARAKRAADYINAHGITLCDDFATWTRVAFAIASAFGEAGEEIFLRVASTSANFRQGENVRKYRNACKTNTGRINISTFFYLCKEANVKF